MRLHKKMSIFYREMCRSKIPGISSKSLKKEKKKEGEKAGQPKEKRKDK